MRLFVRRGVVAVALAVGLGACKDTLDISELEFGFIEITTATGSAPGQFTTRPTGTFFRSTGATGVLNTNILPDSCIGRVPYSANPPSGVGNEFLDAGTVSVAFSNTTLTLAPLTNNQLINYQAPVSSPFTPGDSVTVTVTGAANGFPAVTRRVKTAEAFTLSAVNVPGAGQDLPLTWTPSAGDGAAMVIQLRYAATSSNVINEQLYCALVDDGSHTVPANQIQEWRGANGGLREVAAVRLRSQPARNGSALFQVRSWFEFPTPATP